MTTLGGDDDSCLLAQCVNGDVCMTEPNTGTPSTSCNTSPNSAANNDRCFAHEFGYTSTGATGFCSAGACRGAVVSRIYECTRWWTHSCTCFSCRWCCLKRIWAGFHC